MTIITNTGKELIITRADFPLVINYVPTDKGFKHYRLDIYSSGSICLSGIKKEELTKNETSS